MEYILIGISLGTKFRIDIIMLHNIYYINTYKCVCRHIKILSRPNIVEFCYDFAELVKYIDCSKIFVV